MATALHAHAAEGLLTPPAAVYMARRQPREQLFDVTKDPHELENLADSPRYATQLARLREAHRDRILQHRDLGFPPEAAMWLRFDGVVAQAFEEDSALYSP